MAEQLQIVIDIGEAEANLGKVTKGIKSVGDASAALSGKGANAFDKLVESTNKVKAIPTEVTAGFTALGTSLTTLATSVSSVGELVNGMNRLAKVDVTKVAENVKQLAAALKDIQVPAGLGQMASAFQSLANAANAATSAVRAKAQAVGPLTSAFAALNREALNSIGWMGNFGPTLGRVLQPLEQIAGKAGSVTEVLQGLGAQFSNIGAAVSKIHPAVLALTALAAASALLGPSILEATNKYNRFVVAIDAIKGKGAGAKEFEEVKAMAARTGQSVDALADSFFKFSIASKEAGLSSKVTAQIFEGFSTGLTAMGASSEQSKKAFLALTQMMSKGTVGAEELRQQLGDAMPNAMQIFAKAAGVSEAQLMKLMEQGKILASDIIPKVASALKTQFGGALAAALEQPQQAMNRFGNAIQDLLRNMGSGAFGGLAAGFASGLNQISKALESPAIGMFTKALGDLMGLLTGAILGAIGGLVQGFTYFLDIVAQAAQGLMAFLPPLNTMIVALTGGTSGVGQFTNAIAGIAKILGTVGGGVIAVIASFYAFKGAIIAVTAVYVGLKTAVLSVSSAWVGFMALFGLGPIGAFVVAVVALVAAVVALRAAMTTTAQATDQFGKAITSTSSAMQITGGALREWFTQMREAPNDVFKAVNALNSFANSQANAKTTTAELSKDLKAVKHEVKALTDQDKEAERASALYTDGLKRRKEALHEQEQSLKRLADSTKGATTSTNAHGAANKNSTQKVNDYYSSIKRLQRAQEDIDNALKREAISLDIEKQKRADVIAVLDRQTEKLNLAKESIAEYGVVLTANQQKEVDRLTALGMAKDKAVEMVDQTAKLTQTTAQVTAAAGAQADKYQDLSTAILGNISAIQANREELVKELKSRGENDEAIKTATKTMDDQLLKMTQEAAAYMKQEATLRAAVIAKEKGITVSEALNVAYGELAKRAGIDLPDALKLAQGGFEKQKTSSEEAMVILKSWGDALMTVVNGAIKGIDFLIDKVASVISWMAKWIDVGQKQTDMTAEQKKQLDQVTQGYNSVAGGARAAAAATDTFGTAAAIASAKAASMGNAAPGFRLTGQAAQQAGIHVNAFGDRIQTLKTGYGQVLRILPPVADGIRQTGNEMDVAGAKVGNFNNNVQKIKSGYGQIISIVPQANAGLKSTGDEATAAGGKLGQLSNQIQTLKGGYGTVLGVVPQATQAMNANATSAQAVAEKVAAANARYAGIAPAVSAATNAIQQNTGVQEQAVAAKNKDIEVTQDGMVARQKDLQLSEQKLRAMENEVAGIEATIVKGREYIGLDGQRHVGDTRTIELKARYSEAVQKAIADLQAEIAAKQAAQNVDEASVQLKQKELQTLLAGSDPMKQRAADLKNESMALGEANNKLIERGKTLQESLFQEENSTTKSKEKVEALKAEIAATEEAIASNFKKQEASDTDLQKQNSLIDAIKRNEQGTRLAAEAETAWMQANLNLGPALETKKAALDGIGEGLDGYNQKQNEVVTGTQKLGDNVTTATQQMSVFQQQLSQPVQTGLPQTLEDLTVKMVDFKDTVVTTANVNDKLGQSLDKMQPSAASVGAAVDGAEGQVDQYKEAAGEATEATVASANAFSSAVSSANSLTSAINNLANAYSSLAKAQKEAAKGGGGGNDDQTEPTQPYKEGGIVGQGVGRKQKTDLGDFTNAPALASGTANTSKFASRMQGGGIPSVLHPNEAVVPLSKGRKIPVDLSMNAQQVGSDPVVPIEVKIVPKKVDKLTETTRDGFEQVVQATQDTAKDVVKAMYNMADGGSAGNGRSTLRGVGDMGSTNPPPQSAQTTTNNASGGSGGNGRSTLRGVGGDETVQPVTQAPVNVTINMPVHTTDADTFKRSQDQIAKAQAEKTRRALSRLS